MVLLQMVYIPSISLLIFHKNLEFFFLQTILELGFALVASLLKHFLIFFFFNTTHPSLGALSSCLQPRNT